MLVSFSEKKNKKVVLLSTMYDSGTVSPDTGQLEVIEFYNLTKRWVDCMDKTYTTKRYSRHWPMRYVSDMLDIMGINSYVLYSLARNNCGRSSFLKSVAYNLVES